MLTIDEFVHLHTHGTQVLMRGLLLLQYEALWVSLLDIFGSHVLFQYENKVPRLRSI